MVTQLTPKEKVWLIVLALLAGCNTDQELIDHSQGRLTEDDLDWTSPAQQVVIKACGNREVKPTEAEARSWLNCYEWPDH
jgi:hypothetical protein